MNIATIFTHEATVPIVIALLAWRTYVLEKAMSELKKVLNNGLNKKLNAIHTFVGRIDERCVEREKRLSKCENSTNELIHNV